MKHLILQLCLFTTVVVVRSPVYVIWIKKRNYTCTNVLKIFKTEQKSMKRSANLCRYIFCRLHTPSSLMPNGMFTLSFGDSRHTQSKPIRVMISFVTIVCKVVTSKIP